MRKALEALASQGEEEPKHEVCQCGDAKPQEPRRGAE